MDNITFVRMALALPVLLVGLAAPPADAQALPGRALAIVAPSDERTLYDEGGIVVISLHADPPLAEGERLVVQVDEQLVVLPSGTTKFALTGVPEGVHVLEAIIVDAEANPVAAAETVVFRVGRALRA